MNTYATVVLDAGKGTRMRSTLPKVLHPLAGMPLLAHVLNAIDAIPASPTFASHLTTTATHRPIVVLGHGTQDAPQANGSRRSFMVIHLQKNARPEQVTGRRVVKYTAAAERRQSLASGASPKCNRRKNWVAHP